LAALGKKESTGRLPEAERKRVKNVSTRAIPVQWVIGDAERAEASFFRINKQGTALDSVETPLFMGMANLLAKRLANNDSGFFIKFTKCRKQLEDALVTHKPLIGAIVQQTHTGKRYATVATLFD
jgi:hypothetical protein